RPAPGPPGSLRRAHEERGLARGLQALRAVGPEGRTGRVQVQRAELLAVEEAVGAGRLPAPAALRDALRKSQCLAERLLAIVSPAHSVPLALRFFSTQDLRRRTMASPRARGEARSRKSLKKLRRAGRAVRGHPPTVLGHPNSGPGQRYNRHDG